jgi:hypothetical protein
MLPRRLRGVTIRARASSSKTRVSLRSSPKPSLQTHILDPTMTSFPSPSPLKPTPSLYTSYTFPPIYSFPPFFTPQPNPQTLAHQLALWVDLLLSYCRFHRVYILTEKDLEGDTVWDGKTSAARGGGGEGESSREGVMECFWNKRAGGGTGKGRRVGPEFGTRIWGELVRTGKSPDRLIFPPSTDALTDLLWTERLPLLRTSDPLSSLF